jgi:hypothetical protein
MIKKLFLAALSTLLASFVFTRIVFADPVPVGVTEQEVVANYRAERRIGAFRGDGSDDTFDYCIDSGCFYNPQPGDRINVEFSQGWRLTFWNVGEMGGEAKKLAKLEKITDFLTAGEIVTEVLPPLTDDSLKSGITYSKIISKPADAGDILESYVNPKYTFTLGFTGGPSGVFYEMDGARQHPSGKAIRGDVMLGEDGLYYVQLSGAIIAKLIIDDPAVFDGFTDAPANSKVVFESDYAYGFSDWNGEVYVETPDGEAYLASDFTNTDEIKMIPAGATIKTGSDSYAVIVLSSGGSRLVIGPNSYMKIEKPERGFFDTLHGQVLMKIKRNVERMLQGQPLEVIMNQAVAGCKGTAAILIEEEGVSSIKVLEGAMYLRSKVTNESQDVFPGQTISASAEGLSAITQFDVEAELTAWEQIASKEAIDEIREMIAADQQASIAQEKTSTPAKPNIQLICLLGVIVLVAGSVAVAILIMIFFYLRKQKMGAIQ